MHSAAFVFHFDPSLAPAIAVALAPEAADVPKTRAVVQQEGGEIRLTLSANDLPSLRAAINSYLRWVDAAERAAKLARA